MHWTFRLLLFLLCSSCTVQRACLFPFFSLVAKITYYFSKTFIDHFTLYDALMFPFDDGRGMRTVTGPIRTGGIGQQEEEEEEQQQQQEGQWLILLRPDDK